MGRRKKILTEEELKSKNEPKIPKKRGRKPKGGKIVESKKTEIKQEIIYQNIILHLMCKKKDVTNFPNVNKKLDNNTFIYDPNVSNIQPFADDDNNTTLSFCMLQNKNNENNSVDNNVIINNDNNIEKYNNNENNKPNQNIIENKTIDNKIKELEYSFHNNNIVKKSNCFWCTCEFDNPVIYIPKNIQNNSYNVYGNFCSPECACSYLFNEHIDENIKFERYQLLNFVYCKIYDYTKNIKPAPNPFYTLDKFMGNLSIQEYRKHLKNERLLIVVDKPLTKILPEIYEDNNEIEIAVDNKYLLNTKISQPKKNDIINNIFKK